jgi:uracil-DNA glycosylase
LKLILSLGLTSHMAVLRTFKLKVKDYKFAHGAVHFLNSPPEGESTRLLSAAVGGVSESFLRENGMDKQSPHGCAKGTSRSPSRGEQKSPRATRHPSLLLLDSYHTSRYNISTGRLTQAMFDAVVEQARGLLEL